MESTYSRDGPASPTFDRPGRAHARREKIVEAARALFAEHGFHGTSMARLAKHSGVLVGQIYRDFANKEAIVAEIVERDLAEFLRDDDLNIARRTCDRQAVRDWIARFVACNDSSGTRLVTEILAEALRNERIAAIFHAIDERMRRHLVRALALLVPAPPEGEGLRCLADTIMTLSAGVFHRRLSFPGSVDPSVLDALMDCVDREIDALARKHA